MTISAVPKKQLDRCVRCQHRDVLGDPRRHKAIGDPGQRAAADSGHDERAEENEAKSGQRPRGRSSRPAVVVRWLLVSREAWLRLLQWPFDLSHASSGRGYRPGHKGPADRCPGASGLMPEIGGRDARSLRVSIPCRIRPPAAILDRDGQPKRDLSKVAMSAGRRVAAVVAALTIAANLGTSYVLFATGFLNRFRGPGITDRDVVIVYVFVVAFAAVTVSYVSVGFLLAGRPGAGRVAAVLLAGGATVAVWTFGYAVGGELVFHAPQGEFANAVLLLGPLAIGPGFALILPGMALVFPTGRLPSRRWTLPVGLVAGAMAAGTLIELILPGPITPEPRGSRNPFGIEGLPAGLAAAAYPLVVAAIVGVMVLGVAAVLTRYRSGDATLRHQLRWFIAAVLLAAVPLPISIVPGVGGPRGWPSRAWGSCWCQCRSGSR